MLLESLNIPLNVFLQQILQEMSAEVVKEGYLLKTGSADRGQFRKRWFILDNEKLMYFKKQLVNVQYLLGLL